MRSVAPPGYKTVETPKRAAGVEPELYRWRWRAERRCRKLNEHRPVDTYRHEVCDWLDGRWAVVVMQNICVPVWSDGIEYDPDDPGDGRDLSGGRLP